MNSMQVDWGSVITNLGITGTLLLGFINLFSLRKSEKYARRHTLNTAEYKERKDYILTNLAEYLQLLDAHELSYAALTDEEYEGQDLAIYKKLYSLETLFYKIKLMMNMDNLYYKDFSDALDRSMLLAKTVRSENSFAELLTNGLRTPERALDICNRALNRIRKEASESTDSTTVISDVEDDGQAKLDFISDALKMRDTHLENLFIASQELSTQKELLVMAAQKYLVEEKEMLIN